MAGQRCGDDVSEYSSQNPESAQWLETFRGYCESNKQWSARREFISRNMEAFPTVKPGLSSSNSSSLDRSSSLSMVWANHVFLGCSYPAAVMDKISKMGEGIVVQDPPVHRTTKDGITARGKRSAADGFRASKKVQQAPGSSTKEDSAMGLECHQCRACSGTAAGRCERICTHSEVKTFRRWPGVKKGSKEATSLQ